MMPPGYTDYQNTEYGQLGGLCYPGLLVLVPADEFEASISKNGQIHEYVLLAYTVGMKQPVSVNIMGSTEPPYRDTKK